MDDDGNMRDAIRSVLEDDGLTVEDFASCDAFLEAYRPGREACLLVDAYLPGMSGLKLLERLHVASYRLPAIMITGDSDVQIAVQAMKAGASDFIEKPIGRGELLESVARALEQSRDSNKRAAWQESAANHIAGSRGGNARSWTSCSRATPARTLQRILALASALLKIIVRRS